MCAAARESNPARYAPPGRCGQGQTLANGIRCDANIVVQAFCHDCDMTKFAGFLTGLFGLAFGIVAISAAAAIWSALAQGTGWNAVFELVLIGAVAGGVTAATQKWHSRLIEEEKSSSSAAQVTRDSLPRTPLQTRPAVGSGRPTGQDLLHQDAMLSTYYKYDLDWRGQWEKANASEHGLTPFGVRPYWVPNDEGPGVVPLTSLAFWGEADRVMTASHPETPEHLLAIMQNDPSDRVQRAVLYRL